MSFAEKIYCEAKKQNIEVLLDDRDERAGIKFKDADLIGIPFQIVVGERNLPDKKVEIKVRKSGNRVVISDKEIFGNLNICEKN